MGHHDGYRACLKDAEWRRVGHPVAPKYVDSLPNWKAWRIGRRVDINFSCCRVKEPFFVARPDLLDDRYFPHTPGADCLVKSFNKNQPVTVLGDGKLFRQ